LPAALDAVEAGAAAARSPLAPHAVMRSAAPRATTYGIGDVDIGLLDSRDRPVHAALLCQSLPDCRELLVVSVEALVHGVESAIDSFEPREYLRMHPVDGIGERRKSIVHIRAELHDLRFHSCQTTLHSRQATLHSGQATLHSGQATLDSGHSSR